MKTINFNECKSYAEIENAVKNALRYETIVENDAAADEWFKDAEIDGDVHHDTIIDTEVSIWNEKEQGEEFYNVIVKEHYIDSGSVDYIYSYSININ